MHDMHMAGFSAGGQHCCLTGGNLREDPPQKTLVPARPRRPGPTIKKHAIHAGTCSACLRFAGILARMAAKWRRGRGVRQHVPTSGHGWPYAAHARIRARRAPDGVPAAGLGEPKRRQDPRLFEPRAPRRRKQVLGIRVAVMLTQAPNHVVAGWRHSDNRSLRVYDNDSYARTQGTYTLLGVEVMWRGRAVAVMKEGSPLHHIALEHVPPRRTPHAARDEQTQAPSDSEDSWESESNDEHRARNQPPSSANSGGGSEWPVYDNPVATRVAPQSMDSSDGG